MKLFQDVREAQAHAAAGGQALHVYTALPMPAPAVFKRHKQWGHLFDLDKARLVNTARRLGVRVIQVHHEGLKGQHIDLCGRPLAKAQEASRRQPTTGGE